MNYEKLCQNYIDRCELNELKELIFMVVNFGSVKEIQEAKSGLESILAKYKANPSLRTASNKPCLDNLCQALSVPLLPLSSTKFTMFQYGAPSAAADSSTSSSAAAPSNH